MNHGPSSAVHSPGPSLKFRNSHIHCPLKILRHIHTSQQQDRGLGKEASLWMTSVQRECRVRESMRRRRYVRGADQRCVEVWFAMWIMSVRGDRRSSQG